MSASKPGVGTWVRGPFRQSYIVVSVADDGTVAALNGRGEKATLKPQARWDVITSGNTRMEYMYRDGSNYKTHLKADFTGLPTLEDFRRFLDNGASQFIPEQVGLPNARDDYDSHFEDDHIWNEFLEFEVGVTVDDADSITDFIARFVAAEWDEPAAEQVLAEFIDSRRPGH